MSHHLMFFAFIFLGLTAASRAAESEEAAQPEAAERKRELMITFAGCSAKHTIALYETPVAVRQHMGTADAEEMLGRSLTRFERSGSYYARPFSVEGWKSRSLESRPYWTKVIAGHILGAYNFRLQQPLPDWAPQSAHDFRAECAKLKAFGMNGINRGQLEKAVEKIDGLERGTLRKQRQAEEDKEDEEDKAEEAD